MFDLAAIEDRDPRTLQTGCSARPTTASGGQQPQRSARARRGWLCGCRLKAPGVAPPEALGRRADSAAVTIELTAPPITATARSGQVVTSGGDVDGGRSG
ncbi:hypothetical protein [Alloactinosynnema sp. L-07]|nr:hypothetical protein [Alloactinosynnema sp. L-07]